MVTSIRPSGSSGGVTAAEAVMLSAAGDSPYLADFESDAVWLKHQMGAGPDPAEYDQFYDGWMNKYAETHDGHFPRDPARQFPRLAERLLRQIRDERSGTAATGSHPKPQKRLTIYVIPLTYSAERRAYADHASACVPALCAYAPERNRNRDCPDG
jgi:hypothetical protein